MNKVMISIADAGALIAAGIALLVHRTHKTDYQSIDNILSKNKTGERVSINFFTKTGGLVIGVAWAFEAIHFPYALF